MLGSGDTERKRNVSPAPSFYFDSRTANLESRIATPEFYPRTLMVTGAARRSVSAAPLPSRTSLPR
jgi:hypothetical protein